MNKQTINRVVIAGGGTAGWMAAATLTKSLGTQLEVTLIESDEIGTIGVGEATIPTMLSFHHLLGIDEQEFMKAVNGSIKLGISFENWLERGDKYIHSFGKTGKECWAGEFQHFWLKGLEQGIDAPFGDYCLELQAAKEGKFAISKDPWINYAYHMDATAYGKFLRKFSEKLGAKRIEGMIEKVNLNIDTGFIESLQLKSGQIIEGDLFIDCTGFRSVLSEQALHTGYEDWSNWLPCDSAVATQETAVAPPIPLTRAIALDHGWQWKIPLQNRVGTGLVYSSRYQSDDNAKQTLLDNLEGEAFFDPKVIKFRTGRRLKGWNKNCIAIGLAGGFIEPLESTTIFLISSNLIRLMRLFPINGIEQVLVDEFNKQAKAEIELVRDFVVLHFHATRRTDTAFWRHCRTMPIPDSLSSRLDLFLETGRIFIGAEELFRVDSWTQVMIGQGIVPKQYHPVANLMGDDELRRFLNGYRASIQNIITKLPMHGDFLKHYCPTEI
ncbi:MAG: tryptophan 7-halogenase [Gammaproteobacteria bacterium]|nr:MAG: tryptophan 7-halogenase [Gammaproteobacteria bacterium]